jgi:hypothetical protein
MQESSETTRGQQGQDGRHGQSELDVQHGVGEGLGTGHTPIVRGRSRGVAGGVDSVASRKREVTEIGGGQGIFWETKSLNGNRFLQAGARQKGVQTWAAIIKMEKKPLQVEVGTDLGRTAGGTAGHPEGSRSEHRRVEWGVTEESLGPVFLSSSVQS